MSTRPHDNDQRIAEIALPVPLRQVFDYQIPPHHAPVIKPGVRVVVPFGRQKKIALVVRVKATSALDARRLRPIDHPVDDTPVINAALLTLLEWVSQYYQAPLGEVIKLALPAAGNAPAKDEIVDYRLTAELDIAATRATLSRAPQQQAVLNWLVDQGGLCTTTALKSLTPPWRRALRQLVHKAIVQAHTATFTWPQYIADPSAAPALSASQQQVYTGLMPHQDGFGVDLLHGVTGSGKTEIYLQLAAAKLKQDRQVLVLVPEIALTPQLVERFEQRLGVTAAVLHSSLTAKHRQRAWQGAAGGQARVIIGTRSAVFTAVPQLGLIILDEEHDQSYKQQEGVRYHARDVAIVRARNENVPVVMGSATPSLESLANVKRGRFRLHVLDQRVGNAMLPSIHLLAMSQLPVKQGLSTTLLNAIETNLAAGQQTLIFINRRGYAPVMLCRACGAFVDCHRCHARLTYHQDQSLRCHHCGHTQKATSKCHECGEEALLKLGQGTQRIEATLARCFPQAKIARLDRDAVRKKQELEAVLNQVREQEIDILIGTQMLAKGHDFPGVTLVGVINADHGLFGQDFHCTESMVQQLIQVAGRAGRRDRAGKVLIQTDFPEHPLYGFIRQHDYTDFAQHELSLRQQSGFPPYYYLALIRASAQASHSPLEFLWQIKHRATALPGRHGVIIHDPVASPMARRDGRYRAQLLISSRSRAQRGEFLTKWIALFDDDPQTRRVRWSVDVDPLDLY